MPMRVQIDPEEAYDLYRMPTTSLLRWGQGGSNEGLAEASGLS
eukprot:CAMPEP_0115163572 /NCGR_PEP_ID=MMETSP0227-20121206/72584_1 /TAXON_ID=89957 /ORGANISM="Polarella glacialis, Strain CCMP 1383" /LENGTH=42 /DNA_ID= /DNA_START= /DNA_END= /DNA_ORIENTATION=